MGGVARGRADRDSRRLLRTGRHLEAIRSVQPRGPYLLGGQCNGGLVAYELARRLIAAGETVALVALISSSASNLRFRTLSRVVDHAGRAIGMPESRRRRAFERLRGRYLHQRGLSAGRRLRHLARKAVVLRDEVVAMVRRGAADRSADPGAETERAGNAREQLWAIYQRIDRAYVPGRYSGRICLIWPTVGDESPAEATNRWTRVVAGLDLFEVPGSHLSILTRDVEGLARVLRDALDRACVEIDGRRT